MMCIKAKLSQGLTTLLCIALCTHCDSTLANIEPAASRLQPRLLLVGFIRPAAGSSRSDNQSSSPILLRSLINGFVSYTNGERPQRLSRGCSQRVVLHINVAVWKAETMRPPTAPQALQPGPGASLGNRGAPVTMNMYFTWDNTCLSSPIEASWCSSRTRHDFHQSSSSRHKMAAVDVHLLGSLYCCLY